MIFKEIRCCRSNLFFLVIAKVKKLFEKVFAIGASSAIIISVVAEVVQW